MKKQSVSTAFKGTVEPKSMKCGCGTLVNNVGHTVTSVKCFKCVARTLNSRSVFSDEEGFEDLQTKYFAKVKNEPQLEKAKI